ncbi:MAG: hydrogenase nickel incorporation protein HypB [Anaerolineales bacterium]|nr:hydrogenase nickel incorporation protein HypB [Anaerolineales bacterium]
MSEQRISIIQNILSANDAIAENNRQLLKQARLFSINLMASPGAGKTTLIEQTIKNLTNELRILVIDGDIATTFDADRASAAGATAIQINTGGDCHLDAVMLNKALLQADLYQFDLLIVENVGNLVCPASFDLGTALNVLVASVPEGHDKPHKYPSMYRGVDYVILNKIDLLPYVDFDVEFFRKGLEALNPSVDLLLVSCRTGEGLSRWFQWLHKRINEYRTLLVE